MNHSLINAHLKTLDRVERALSGLSELSREEEYLNVSARLLLTKLARKINQRLIPKQSFKSPDMEHKTEK